MSSTWWSLAPALALTGYFVLGLMIYSVRWLRQGSARDQNIESRGSSVFIGMWARLYLGWVTRPIFRLLVASRIPADAITTLSVLLAAAAGVALATGHFALGGWLYIVAGICDFFDGRLARETGKTHLSGAVLDSVLDRVSDAAVLSGLAWYYRGSWVLAVVLAALAGSMFVPYLRAKGEALGVKMAVGLMQRPERLVYLGVTTAFAPLLSGVMEAGAAHPNHVLAIVGVVLLAVTSLLTSAQRLRHLLKALDERERGEALQSAPEAADASPSAAVAPEPRPARPPWWTLGRAGMPRHLIASLVATGLDFGVFLILVEGLRFNPALATVLACGVGAVSNFLLNRVWTFGSEGSYWSQAARYLLVSTSSALLNSGGVAVLLFLPLHHRVVWWIVRAAVYLAWNYPLHRNYVFASDEPLSAAKEALHGSRS